MSAYSSATFTRRCLRLFLTAGILGAGAEEADALACTASIDDVVFSSVDILAGTTVDTTANVHIACTEIGPLGVGVRVCPYIGDGSGGRDSTARYMQGPSTALAYQLYRDSGHSLVWGDAALGFGSVETINFPGNLAGTATGSINLTLYGQVLGGQGAIPAGAYVSNFTAAQTRFVYGQNVLGLVPCDALPLLTSEIEPTFTVSANVENNCILTANDIDFGTHGVLTADVTSEGAINLQCTPDTDYSVALNNGNTGTGPTAREMIAGSDKVTYGLYKDSNHTQPWGDGGTPGSTLQGSGTGDQEQIPVYGLVPPQPTPSPGTYVDSIVATVTY